MFCKKFAAMTVMMALVFASAGVVMGQESTPITVNLDAEAQQDDSVILSVFEGNPINLLKDRMSDVIGGESIVSLNDGQFARVSDPKAALHQVITLTNAFLTSCEERDYKGVVANGRLLANMMGPSALTKTNEMCRKLSHWASIGLHTNRAPGKPYVVFQAAFKTQGFSSPIDWLLNRSHLVWSGGKFEAVTPAWFVYDNTPIYNSQPCEVTSESMIGNSPVLKTVCSTNIEDGFKLFDSKGQEFEGSLVHSDGEKSGQSTCFTINYNTVFETSIVTTPVQISSGGGEITVSQMWGIKPRLMDWYTGKQACAVNVP